MNAKLPIIHKGDSGTLNFSPRAGARTNVMLYLFFGAVVIFFLLMASRLFQLTIVKGAYYRGLSEDNRVREVVVEAKRGSLLDRKGYVIAESAFVEVTENDEREKSKRVYHSPEAFAHVIGYRQTADEQDIKNDACLNKLGLGDTVGKKGVEKLFECELRGRNGKKLMEVNAQGESERALHVIEPENGENIQLSLDSDLQKRAYQMLEGKKGSVVIVNPQTGEVLALASNPSFNPQVFEDNNAEAITQLLQDENRPLFNRATEGTYPPGSVFKMAMITAGLEESAVTKEDTILDTGKVELGDREFGTWAYLEQGRTEGDINAVKALQRSNDIYFYKLSEKLGPEKMKKWAELFGFHNLTGIGISESMGTIPSPFWKEDTIGEQWYTGDSYNFSIGQGYVLATPLQVAIGAVPFANGGLMCKPMLVKNGNELGIKPDCKALPISENSMQVVRQGMYEACKPGGTAWPLFNFRVKDVSAIEEQGASESAELSFDNESSGSARVAGASQSAQLEEATSPTRMPEPTSMPIEELWDANYLASSSSAYLRDVPNKEIELGCKTGTAESGGKKKPHAWFTAFGPFEDPQILVSVMLEEAGQGSDMAAPIAREMLRMYFEREE